MVNIDLYLVTFFIFVLLVTTKMAASQSGSDDVRVTSTSSTTSSASSSKDCFTVISRASVCSALAADAPRQNDVVTTSQPNRNVTMTSTSQLSKNDVTTTSLPADGVATSGASCEVSRPRKSETDWMFRWPISPSNSYLNLTLDSTTAGDSIVSGGYFVVLDSRCNDDDGGLRWNVTIVDGRERRKTINVVSRIGMSPVEDTTTFWFSLGKSLPAKEVYVAFAGIQRDATRQQEQHGRQEEADLYCGFVVDLELLHPCDGSAEVDVISNVTTKSDDRNLGSTTDDGTMEHGTSQKTSPKSPNDLPTYHASTTDTVFSQSRRGTPIFIVSGDTTPFFGSTTSSSSSSSSSSASSSASEDEKPQNIRGSFRIRNEQFIPNLSQETTNEFKSLYSQIFPLLNASYASSCGPFYRRITKISFRSGSIVVDNWFELIGNFDDETRNKTSMNILDEFSRNGMDVDPKSFEFESYTGDDTKTGPTKDSNFLLIVVVSTVLGVLVLALFVIASLLIWRKTRRRDPQHDDDTERQRAAQETRTRDVISGMPRSQLMWQNMPSLKAGFDDQSLFVYELPTPSPAKLHPTTSNRKLPNASSSSFSSSSTSSSSSAPPRNFLNYSQSESKHDPTFYIPRPRATAETTHASFSGISSRGWGQTPRGWGNSQHQHGVIVGETSQVWGQLPLDYNSVTHDYFVSGPSTISVEPTEKRNVVVRPQSTRPWNRTKLSQRKSGSAPDAVDFGDVFLPSAPPFQLSDVLRCHELVPEGEERSGKTTRRSTSIGCGVGGRSVVEMEECTIDGVNNNSASGQNGQQNGLDGKCRTSRFWRQSSERMTSPTQSPHASGSITNSQVNLLSAIYSKSPKKKQSSQTPDNIHRSTMLTLADDAFFQNINSTSEL